jgi:hypothetical protein
MVVVAPSGRLSPPQAGDRRTVRGRSPSVAELTSLRLEDWRAVSHVLLGADPPAPSERLRPLRHHCGTSKNTKSHHCSIQCLQSALPRSASRRNALKRMIYQPHRNAPNLPLGPKFLHLTTDTTGQLVPSDFPSSTTQSRRLARSNRFRPRPSRRPPTKVGPLGWSVSYCRAGLPQGSIITRRFVHPVRS